MIKSILKYAGKYKILTIVATIMVVIAVAAEWWALPSALC